jgi:HEAT repeat protein
MSHTLDDLMKPFWDNDYDAMELIGRKASQDPSIVRTLRRGLKDAEHDVRLGCIKLCGYLGIHGKSAVPDLVQIIRSRKKDYDTNSLRHEAFSSIRRIGKENVPLLIELSKDRDVLVRAGAVAVLRHCDLRQEGVVEAFLDSFLDDDGSVRTISVSFLEQNEAKLTPDVWRKVAQGLHSPHLRVRVYSAQCILRAKGDHKVALQIAIAGLQERDRVVRYTAAEALANTKGKCGRAAIQALAGALKDGDVDVRVEAARGLYVAEEKARPAVAALREALTDPDDSVTGYASAALAHFAEEG